MTTRGKPFAAGADPRRHQFTAAERHRGGKNGWKAAKKAALAHSVERWAWLYYRIRGWWRARRRREQGGEA